MPTSINASGATPKLNQSVGDTPYRNGDRLFDSPAARATPMARPAMSATLICFNATPTTADRLAPSADRTASSRERCVTLYDKHAE